MRKSATNDDVLSTREAAERLGVALRTVQLWVEGGVLPAWKTAGGHRRISRVAVERLIDERRSALAGENVSSASTRLAGAPAVSEDQRGALDSPDPHVLRILLVEDEPVQQQLLSLAIQGWGLPVSLGVAADGFEALLRVGQQCPDLLITDLHMPGMDGFRMVGALRALGQAYADMDIVVVTGLSAAEVAARGGLPSGVRLIYKPVPFDELEQLVRARVERLEGAAQSAAAAAD